MPLHVVLDALELLAQLGVGSRRDPELEGGREDRAAVLFPQDVERLLDRDRALGEAFMRRLDSLIREMGERCTHELGTGAEIGDLRSARDTGELGDATGRRLRVAMGDEGFDRRLEQRRARFIPALGLGTGAWWRTRPCSRSSTLYRSYSRGCR